MKVKLIECPRDAMQGRINLIDTDTKVNYLNALLQVGFDALDCGSFVSGQLIPQMADTAEVIKRLKMTQTKLSVVVANARGAQKAVEFDEISYIGFPFSISETFQKRNTNASIVESVETVKHILDLCQTHSKKFTCYISMGFGNPYNDPWDENLVVEWLSKLKALGVNYFSLSDTVGISNAFGIKSLIERITSNLPGTNFGCHFHTRPDNWEEKIEAAYMAGCRRFDGALKGIGGCPMADDELIGNMPTENLVAYFEKKNIKLGLDKLKLNEALQMAQHVFA